MAVKLGEIFNELGVVLVRCIRVFLNYRGYHRNSFFAGAACLRLSGSVCSGFLVHNLLLACVRGSFLIESSGTLKVEREILVFKLLRRV